MQLSTIKVSNILSFPYVENLTNVEGVRFHNDENGISNILIGPNGSGKSNLLDIVASVWKYAITKDFEFHEDGTIHLHSNNNNHQLKKFHGLEEFSAHVYLSIFLNSDDINNILFLINHREEINTIIQQKSSLNIQFPLIEIELIESLHKIPLYCTLENNILFLEPNNDPIISFVHSYFQNFELLQICRKIHNETQNKKRPALRNTFAFITTAYNYESTSTNKPVRLLLQKYNNLTQFEDKTDRQSLIQQFFLDALNNTLEHYISLHIEINDHTIWFYTKEGYRCEFHELSSGEQSFVRLIFLIYSHDLHNGLLIIDEPEIHLHPQAQKDFLNLIEEMIDKQHMQVIIATHSPSLINAKNIHNVFRCTKIQGETKIYSTPQHGKQSDSTLLQLLKFDAIAKVFFVDKIILVEGDTDLYFFSHYLEYLATLPERKSRIKNYEIIAISGKGGVGKWKHFLKKFHNNVSYIGDWDNIAEFGIVTHQEIQSLKQERSKTNQGSKYTSTVQYIRKNKPKLLTHINNGILNLYQYGTFILKQGDLESYLGTHEKGLDETVRFCNEHFDNRLQNNSFQEKREELLTIVGRIF